MSRALQLQGECCDADSGGPPHGGECVEHSTRRKAMGKKPAERQVKDAAPRMGTGFEAGMPDGCCGAPSRRVRAQSWACANGHRFVSKSDYR
jgi:hypothetical protein